MNHITTDAAVPLARSPVHGLGKWRMSEASFRKILYLAGLGMLILLLAIFFSLMIESLPALRRFGFGFLIGKTWDPVQGEFGALPFLVGTLMSSFIALFIAMIFSLPVSIFLGEYFRQGGASTFMKSVIELLAGIPSVIYGFWGLFFLVPMVRGLEMILGIPPLGVGIFTASLILAVMIIPYAASIGTPIKASGDGKIIFRGKKGGYGRAVIIKHGSKYSTLYAHMNEFAKNTQVGKRIHQGQIIGYVGKSGLATGPHLHYEFRVDGVHRNPLTVKLPDASPLPASEMQRFKSATADQFARLDKYSSTLLAQRK